ncbi:MAG: ABC transporter ATP-binding protein [Deltaproteobacteria bacterium]|uniref:Nickel import system ATP-binding protein NikD n=1 Tax=Candidatus Zymogenus saltonus TaxID=2844893 RepID=A0A9D8KFI2_9DELT|nr:ABC transporter ATP-binding protein [Candidatus Zymogenus saltonus]
MSEILKVENLKTHFFTDRGTIRAVDGVDLSVKKRETLGLVGESGSGKSMTALSIMRLVPPPGKTVSGSIRFKGSDLLNIEDREMRKIRGDEISMIFQEPMTSLNPVYTIGEQIAEVFRYHRDMSRDEIEERSIEMLRQVEIPSPESRYRDYPHQLSGGMRQRVMIAMALALSPDLMIADEPTTALDVTIQASILDLINKIKEEMEMSVILITHDLGVVHEVADRISVMYAGAIVEESSVADLFKNPLHPYTRALLKSLPSRNVGGKKLFTIPGSVPKLSDLPVGCRFSPRCRDVMDICLKEEPEMKGEYPSPRVRCWLYC